MSKIGYIRVSTERQETARQQEIMCDYQVDRIFSEKLSGATTDRPQLKAMLDYVREDDTLYVESISRLGRSTKDLLNIIDTLTDKGVTLISHKESIDTNTPTGKFMLTVFAALSQLEREQLKQRQREGIEIAKAQGKYTGRKPIPIADTVNEKNDAAKAKAKEEVISQAKSLVQQCKDYKPFDQISKSISQYDQIVNKSQIELVCSDDKTYIKVTDAETQNIETANDTDN